MPSLNYAIPVIDDAIATPVAVQVFRQLKERLELGAETELIYAGETNAYAQTGVNLTSTNDDPMLNDRHRVFVVSRETPIEELALTSPLSYTHEALIMADEKIGWSATPVYSRVEATLEFTYRSATKHQADQVAINMHSRLITGTTHDIMGLIYEYPVPEHVLAIIKDIHAKREAQFGYGDAFVGPGEYLEQCIMFPYTYKTNQAGDWQTLVFRPLLFDVSVWLDDRSPPTPERMEDGSYQFSLLVRWRYDRASHVTIQYPIWVHNQFVKYYDKTLDRNKDLKTPVKYSGALMASFNTLRDRLYGKLRSTTGYIIPSYDDWITRWSRQKTQDVFQMLVQVDPNDPTLIVDLKSLYADTNLLLHPQLLKAFAKPEIRGKVFYENQSLVSFIMYEKNDWLHPHDYYLNEAMELRAHQPLNPRHHYHLKMGVIRDITLINWDDLEDWLDFGDLIIDIIDFIDPTFPKDKLPPLNPDGSIDIRPVIPELRPGLPDPDRLSRPIMATVNSIAIMTYNEVNDATN